MGWQWYSAALPRWTESLIKKGFQEGQAENIARRIGRAWPGASAIGLFALHTTAAAVCAIHFGPWLAGRWFPLGTSLDGKISSRIRNKLLSSTSGVGEHPCRSGGRLRHLWEVPETGSVCLGCADSGHVIQALHLH